MTNVTLGAIGVAFFTYCVYAISITVLVRPFTYIGFSAVFLSFNLFPMIYIVYLNAPGRRVDFAGTHSASLLLSLSLLVFCFLFCFRFLEGGCGTPGFIVVAGVVALKKRVVFAKDLLCPQRDTRAGFFFLIFGTCTEIQRTPSHTLP